MFSSFIARGWLVLVILACALAANVGATAAADPADSAYTSHVLAPPVREVVFTPDHPSRAHWFFITETTGSYVAGSQPDHLLLTDSFGFMRNFGESNALGGSMDFHFLAGADDIRYAPSLRYRHWFDRRKSLELSLGYAPGDVPGICGPNGSVRFSPTPVLHLQVGAYRVREVEYTYLNGPTYGYQIHERKPVHLAAGVGFGGIPGAALWGVQAILVGAAIAALAAGGGWE